MILYRIASKNFAQDLFGTGAMLYGGRLNQVGVPMIYTSYHLSLATLEIIVNLSSIQINKGLYCCEINLPDHLPVTELKELPERWNQFPHIMILLLLVVTFLKRVDYALKYRVLLSIRNITIS